MWIFKMVNKLLISVTGFKRAGWESACGELAGAWRRHVSSFEYGMPMGKERLGSSIPVSWLGLR